MPPSIGSTISGIGRAKDENMWPAPPAYQPPPMDPSQMKNVSDEVQAMFWDDAAVVDQTVYDRINALHGTNFEPRVKPRR